jgi:hypothetical protein
LFALAYPLLINPDYLKTLLLEQVQHEVGRKIEVGDARLELFPRIRLQLFDVVIWDVDPAHRFFSARHMDVYLRVFSFLRKRVIVKRLSVDQPKIELRRDRDGRWNVLSDVELPSALPLPGDRGGHSPLGLLLLVREITLHNGEVHLIDESRQDGRRALGLGQVEVRLKSKAGGLPLEVNFEGRMLDTPSTSGLKLRGRLSHGPSPVRIAPAESSRATHGFQFDGLTEAAEVDVHTIAEFFGPLPVPEGVQGAASMRGRITILPGVVGYDLLLLDMKLNVESLSVTGQASLAGLLTPQPTFSLTFSASPVDLDDLLKGIPPAWLHPQLRQVVREQGVAGTVEVVNATMTGTTVPEPRVSITGEVRVTHGRAFVGHDRTPVDKLAGTVLIEPDRLKVTNLSGSYGTIDIQTGKATVSFIRPGPWLELEFTGSTPAADVAVALARGTKPPAIKKALGQLRDVKGECQVTYHLAGPLREGGSVEFLDGEFIFRDAEFGTPLLAPRVVGLSGRLKVQPDHLLFDRFTARLGKAQLDVHGIITTEQDASFEGVTVGLKGDADQVLELLSAGTLRSSPLHGSVRFWTAVAGSVDAPSLRGTLDLKDAEITLPGFLTKAGGRPAAFEFDAGLHQGPALNFKKLELLFPPLRLAARGALRLGTPMAHDWSIITGPLALPGGLPEGVTGLTEIERGTLEVSLDVKGRGTDWKGWHYNGWIALTDGLIKPKGMERPLKDIYLRLRLDRHGGEIKRLAMTIEDSDVAISGTIRGWTRVPTYTLTIESSDFDIDLVIPKGGRSPFRDFMEELAATSRVTADVAIDRPRYRTLQFESLSGRVTVRDNAVAIDRINTVLENGRVAAHVVLNIPKNQPADGEVAFQLLDVPTVKVLHALGDEKRLILGDLTANGALSIDGTNPLGVLASMNGTADFHIKKGRIQRGNILPKLLTILNIGSVLQGKVDLAKEGLPFDRVTGSVVIQNGVVTTKALVIDSPILKMSEAGTYNMVTDQLDGVLVASPLGPYAQALKSIPLFGKLFTGERRGIDTAIFEVKGPLNDPSIHYMPVKSLTTGVTGLAQFAVDVLKNVVLLPKALIPPVDGSDASPEPPSPTSP